MKTLFQILAILTTILASVSAHAVEPTDFGPYKGKVVDADTKEPIEGVVVLVEWWQIHTGNSTLIDAQETMTDANGEFHLPGIRVFSPWKRSYSEAILTIYKSEYKHISAGVWKKWEQLKPSLKYVWKIEDGKPIFVIEKFKNMEDRKKYSSVPISLVLPCEKSRIIWREINKENKFLGYGEESSCRK